MQYFKNSEVAELFTVHKSTVAKWIKAAIRGDINLQLHDEGGRSYIANTASNSITMEELVAKGRKHRNSRFVKSIAPRPEFYHLFADRHVLDIMSEIATYREIPMAYTYFDGGANLWDKYSRRLLNEPGRNTLKSTIELLESSHSMLERLIGDHQAVNVIDLGPGNCLPVRGLLSRLLEQGKLNRYIGIDISEEMLEIAGRNIEDWFGAQVKFEGYARDFNHETFKDLTLQGHFNGRKSGSTLNLILLLGGTLSNERSPRHTLENIKSSLAPPDLLVYTKKLDLPQARRYFDFNVETQPSRLGPQHVLIPDLLNIDPSFYNVEQEFDEILNERRIQVRLKVDLSIEFEIGEENYQINLSKNEAILLWRAKHVDTAGVTSQFAASGFHTTLATETDDHGYLLTVSDLKHQPNA